MHQLLLRGIGSVARRLRPSQPMLPLQSGALVLYLQYETPLGCCVHGTPLVDALRACAPGVRVIVATRAMGAATLAHHSAVEYLLDSGGNPFASARAMLNTAVAIRRWLREHKLRPDWVISDASSRRPGSALLGTLLGIAPTAGFSEAAALHDVPLSYDSGLSLIDNNLRLAHALGGGSEHREPAVFFSPSELAQAEQMIGRSASEAIGRIGFVLQGSGGQRTGWHDDRFAAVIRQLETEGYQTFFLGTASDVGGIDRVRALAPSSGRSLAGMTSIPVAAAVLSICDLLITIDTGTMHLGRAVGVPMVVLGPSWQRPLEWLPLGLASVRVLRGPDRSEAPPGYKLDEIEVDEVLRAARELLGLYPPTEAARRARVEARLSSVRS